MLLPRAQKLICASSNHIYHTTTINTHLLQTVNYKMVRGRPELVIQESSPNTNKLNNKKDHA